MPARPRLALLQLLLASTCCFFPRPSAAVEGVNAAWNHRFGQGTGVRNLAFACDTHEGVNVMTGSFISSIALSPLAQ